ncbi:DUF2804 domain-containing protein [uncultured Ferrimonas sp.]|uniref:DUF2804 domain-containing protein n=1 Tax=uncultured Ferrimonas sp. TaxID=432640 RepID=UPI002638DF41|nr:DUF2804 domain-containing protein [uncultured Ferrimonas sp.]
MSQPLIDANGQIRFGHFGDSIEQINIGDYRHRTPMGGHASALSSWLGYKQFQYVGVLSEQLLFGCAIAHLRHTAIAFVYLYQPGSGMLLETTKRAPFGVGVSLTNDIRNGSSQVRLGDLHITIGHHQQRKRLTISQGRALNVDLWFSEAEFEPLGQCSRIGRNGWAYARKVAGVRCHGQIQCGAQQFDLGALNAFAHHDFSAGYMRRETFWNWACLSGQNQNGDRVGLNLSCGVNETSVSENALWRNGQLLPLPLCHFDYDWDHPLQPWRIYSEDGVIELQFQPQGQHTERLNLGFAASDFKQIFGQFRGRIRQADGQLISVDGLWGFVEDQYAKW